MCKATNCTRPLYKAGYCKTHSPERQRAYRKANPRQFKRYTLKRDYGISLELYQRLLVEQGGVCAICGVPSGSERSNNNGYKSLSVDHNHLTGAVRGLLCGSCNKGIGSLMDSPVLLRRAAEYLERKQSILGAVDDPFGVKTMLEVLRNAP